MQLFHSTSAFSYDCCQHASLRSASHVIFTNQIQKIVEDTPNPINVSTKRPWEIPISSFHFMRCLCPYRVKKSEVYWLGWTYTASGTGLVERQLTVAKWSWPLKSAQCTCSLYIYIYIWSHFSDKSCDFSLEKHGNMCSRAGPSTF